MTFITIIKKLNMVISSIWYGVIETFWAQKIMQEKSTKFKETELYQVFRHKFLCEIVWIFLLNILLTRRVNTFCSRGINNFWSGGIKPFWAQKTTQRSLNYTKSLYIICCPKLFQYSKYIYYFQKTSTNFGLEVSKHFCLKS